MGKNSNKKRKFRLRKRARRTIASLMLVSALVVSLIPTTQKKTQAYIDPGLEVISLDEVIQTYHVFGEADKSDETSVKAKDDDLYYAFPYIEADPENDPPMDVSGTDITTGETITMSYHMIDMSGMTRQDKTPVPVFQMGVTSSGETTLEHYRGYEGEFNGNVNLANGVCYNKQPVEEGKEKRVFDYAEGGRRFRYTQEYIKDTIDPGSLERKFYKVTVQELEPLSDNAIGKAVMFYACDSGSNVHNISDEAFKGSSHVKRIDISSSELRKIGNSAFEGCSSLEEITLSDKVASVGRKAFCDCGSLSTVNFPEGDGTSLGIIGDGAFANCGFSSFVFPFKSGLQIGAGAFYGCESFGGLNEMFSNFKSGKVTVGPFAFAKCKELTDVVMYKDMESTNRVTTDDKGYDFDGLFAGCIKLRSVELPENYGTGNTVCSLGRYMFQQCNGLQRVKFCGRKARPYNDFQFVTKSNQDYAAEKGYDKFTVDESFVIEGPNPYPPGSTEPTVNTETESHLSAIEFSNTYMYKVKNGDIEETKYELVVGNYNFNYDNGTINAIIPKQGANATLTIPTKIGANPINAIGDKAFKNTGAGADKLEKLVILDNIESIGNNAFAGIKSLKYVKFDNEGVGAGNGTSIGSRCFYDCPELLEVDFIVDDYKAGPPKVFEVNSIDSEAFKTQRTSSFTDDKLLDLVIGGKHELNRLGGDNHKIGRLSLVMKGDIDPSYVPYVYALNLPESGGETAESAETAEYDIFPEGAPVNKGHVVSDYIDNSYITYSSGNPANISMKYDSELGGVSLITYPTEQTMVGRTSAGDIYKISNIIDKTDGRSGMEADIIKSLIHITVPEGVDCLDDAVNTSDDLEKYKYIQGLSGVIGDDNKYVNWITLNVSKLPELEDILNSKGKVGGIFNDDKYLKKIHFEKDITDIGTLPFLFVYDKDNYEWAKGIPDCSIDEIEFRNEGNHDDATESNPYYWEENGIIYSYDGVNTTLEEVLYGRGNDKLPNISNKYISIDSDPALGEITRIAEGAFMNCPYLRDVDLRDANKLKEIPKNCFVNCTDLETVSLPPEVKKIGRDAFYNLASGYNVFIYGKGVDIDDDAFDKTKDPTIRGYKDSEVEYFANRQKIRFKPIDGICKVSFHDWDMTILPAGDPPKDYQWVDVGSKATAPVDPTREGYIFKGWRSNYGTTEEDKITQDPTVFVAQYELNPSSSSTDPPSTSSSSTTTTSSSSSSSSSTSKSSSKKSSSDSSSSSSSTGSSSSSSASSSSARGSSGGSSSNPSLINSSTVPIVISGYASAPSGGQAAAGSAPGEGQGTANTAGRGGRTNVVSTTDGITDVGKMSAKVNGSSDNYVVKISETAEADAAAVQALTAEFGSLNDIRYLPIDISLYDSTGTNKISPVPDGITVSVTIPIPDDLAIYGGNAKAASTLGGTLEKMAPRFTVIDSVPCMTFTATHFSPYVIYVDTANLAAEGTLDSTPKTGDMIHPKWFLVIGLIAAALFMFLKKDNEESFAAA